MPLPDIRGREQILNVHMRKVPIGQDVNASVLFVAPRHDGADFGQPGQRSRPVCRPPQRRVVEMIDFERAKDKSTWALSARAWS